MFNIVCHQRIGLNGQKRDNAKLIDYALLDTHGTSETSSNDEDINESHGAKQKDRCDTKIA